MSYEFGDKVNVDKLRSSHKNFSTHQPVNQSTYQPINLSTRHPVELVAEEGASLSSGSLRLYALPYGCVDLYAYDPLNRRAAVGIMVATEHRRKGYALAMLEALRRMAADTYRLHCLYADIATTNTASTALFRKAGYSECGHFKEWLEYDSHFVDTIRMQLIL